MWILATAAAFSDVQSVGVSLGSWRPQPPPALQPAELRPQPAVVSLQSSPPLFAVRGHVAGQAPPASAATWVVPSALLAAALLTRVRRAASEASGHRLKTNTNTTTAAAHFVRYAPEAQLQARAPISARARNVVMGFDSPEEETFIMVKPDGVVRGLAGRILRRFEDKGLRLVRSKLTLADPDILKEHYAHIVDKPFFPDF